MAETTPTSTPELRREVPSEAEGDPREPSAMPPERASDPDPSTGPSPKETEAIEEQLRQRVDGREILQAVETVERDSTAIAQSYASLFSSLRLALAEVSGNSVEHMHCFNDIAGSLQESVLDAATKGNKFIHSCLRLNEEMKGIDLLALHLKKLRRNVDTLEVAVNRSLHF